jgi:hypothetical protein
MRSRKLEDKLSWYKEMLPLPTFPRSSSTLRSSELIANRRRFRMLTLRLQGIRQDQPHCQQCRIHLRQGKFPERRFTVLGEHSIYFGADFLHVPAMYVVLPRLLSPKMLHTMSDEAFELILKVHNTAPFRIIREAAPYLRAKDPAVIATNRSIVNVSSIAGLHGYVFVLLGWTGTTSALTWRALSLTATSARPTTLPPRLEL